MGLCLSRVDTLEALIIIQSLPNLNQKCLINMCAKKPVEKELVKLIMKLKVKNIKL